MTAAAPPRDHARRAYDAFAPFYDSFTRHHDYEGWTASLEAAARRAGLKGRRLLDIACGTGKSFLPYLRRGYAVTACDVAPEMLAIAARKAGGRARLEVHDMRELPRLGAFDLVCLLDDAVNYLDTADEVTAALRGAARNLAPGGVVVFDANTLAAYRTFFATASVVHDGDAVLMWDGRTPPDLEAGGAAEADLLAFVPDGDDTDAGADPASPPAGPAPAACTASATTPGPRSRPPSPPPASSPTPSTACRPTAPSPTASTSSATPRPSTSRATPAPGGLRAGGAG